MQTTGGYRKHKVRELFNTQGVEPAWVLGRTIHLHISQCRRLKFLTALIKKTICVFEATGFDTVDPDGEGFEGAHPSNICSLGQ
jgi:hypothetical protein